MHKNPSASVRSWCAIILVADSAELANFAPCYSNITALVVARERGNQTNHLDLPWPGFRLTSWVDEGRGGGAHWLLVHPL